jgi:hypothetical protein
MKALESGSRRRLLLASCAILSFVVFGHPAEAFEYEFTHLILLYTEFCFSACITHQSLSKSTF